MTRSAVFGVVAALIVAGPMACGPPIGSTTSSSKSSFSGSSGSKTTAATSNQVQVMLTDDPYPYNVFSRMSIRVTKLEVQDTAGNWVTVQEWTAGPGVFEVLSLRNGKAIKVATNKVPALSFSAVRMTIPSIRCFTTDGTAFDAEAGNGGVLECPVTFSAQGGTVGVLVDLNVERSVGVVGADWLDGAPVTKASQVAGVTFNPVGRAAALGQGGTIQGSVADASGSPLTGASIRCFTADGVEFGTAATDETGVFAFVELPSADYSLVIESTGGPLTHVYGIHIDKGDLLSYPIVLGTDQGTAPGGTGGTTTGGGGTTTDPLPPPPPPTTDPLPPPPPPTTDPLPPPPPPG